LQLHSEPKARAVEENNIKKLSFLLFLSVILGVFTQYLPLLSSQGKIDPQNLHNEYDPKASMGIFNNQLVTVPTFNSQVLGDVISLPDGNLKTIEVDLTNQRLYGFENGQKIFDFLISSGTYNRTPNGTFYIWTKIKSQKMSGGSKELNTYYYLPNVPNILFFYNDSYKKELGFSLHGTYWHHNFGTPMSHGCINMYTPDSLQIFNWANIGTTITIYGKYH